MKELTITELADIINESKDTDVITVSFNDEEEEEEHGAGFNKGNNKDS